MAKPNAPLGKAAVIAELRVLARRGLCRKADVFVAAPHLATAVARHWGTFTRARRAAGLGPPPRPRRWTRAIVLAEIHRLAASGQRMTVEALAQIGRIDLTSAAVSHFGRWVRARDLAGVPTPPPLPAHRDSWTARAILAEIKHRHRAGLPLAATRVSPSLRRAGETRFGNWGTAIEKAGLHYADVRLRAHYADDDIRRALRQLARRSPRLTAEAFRRSKLGNVAIRRWGSLAEIAAATGLSDWPRLERTPLPTADELLRLLRARARTASALVADRRLAIAAQRHFGSWHAALDAAGVAHLQAQRRWTAAAVLTALRRRHRTGASLSSSAIAVDDSALAHAVIRYFGSIVKARAAAGFKRVLRRRWTRDAVLAELRRLARGRATLRQRQVPSRLAAAAAARFGSWSAACAAAGVTATPPE